MALTKSDIISRISSEMDLSEKQAKPGAPKYDCRFGPSTDRANRMRNSV